MSQEEGRTHNTASSRTASPTHHQRAIPAPLNHLKPTLLLLSLCYFCPFGIVVIHFRVFFCSVLFFLSFFSPSCVEHAFSARSNYKMKEKLNGVFIITCTVNIGWSICEYCPMFFSPHRAGSWSYDRTVKQTLTNALIRYISYFNGLETGARHTNKQNRGLPIRPWTKASPSTYMPLSFAIVHTITPLYDRRVGENRERNGVSNGEEGAERVMQQTNGTKHCEMYNECVL